jgi:hypothetical protein
MVVLPLATPREEHLDEPAGRGDGAGGGEHQADGEACEHDATVIRRAIRSCSRRNDRATGWTWTNRYRFPRFLY